MRKDESLILLGASVTPDHQGSNFESCVWRAVPSHSSHHPPQEVLLVRFSLDAHKGGLKPHLFHFKGESDIIVLKNYLF